jgi:hypothetical protein
MNLPGFTAEAALWCGSGHYYTAANAQNAPAAVNPAMVSATMIICGPCMRYGGFSYQICRHVVNGVTTIWSLRECG